MHTVLQWMITFLFINVTWIFFRADSISQAVTVIKKILRFQNLNVRASMLEQFKLTEFAFIYEYIPGLNEIVSSIRGFDALILMTAALVICLAFKNNQEMEFKPTVRRSLTAILYLVWGIMSLSGVSEFLYFNF